MQFKFHRMSRKMDPFRVIASLTLFIICCDGIVVLRSTLEPSQFGTAKGGAGLINSETRSGLVESFTLCFRFYLKILGRGATTEAGRILMISDWRIVLQLFAWYPSSFLNVGFEGAPTAFNSYLLEESDLGFQVFIPDVWNHLCFSFNSKTAQVRAALNGRILTTNFVDQNVRDLRIPAELLESIYLGRLPTMCNTCSTPGARFTDLNVWDRELSEAEVLDWTACKKIGINGSFISWTNSTWTLDNMVKEEVADSSICEPPKPHYVAFPYGRNMSEAIQLCKRMRGSVGVAKNETIDDLVSQWNNFRQTNNAWWMWRAWGGWSDAKQEGTFMDVNTNEKLSSSYAPFNAGEPNGKEMENCVELNLGSKRWTDIPCDERLQTFCHLPARTRFKIRGLPYRIGLDAEYSLNTDRLHGDFYTLVGYTSTWLYHDKTLGHWRLDLRTDKETWAITNSSDYPLGLRQWMINSTEFSGLSKLNIDVCDDQSEYNCNDGSCVPIIDRCNGKIDCADGSDEIRCERIVLKPSYLKDFPAPSPQGGSHKATITINVDLLGVGDIDEVKSIIEFQYRMTLVWRDLRLQFLNLKNESYMNALARSDAERIWYPKLVFYSTKAKEETEFDTKSLLLVNRTGKFHPSPSSMLHNDHIYNGDENDLLLSRVYTNHHECVYDMKFYPFDVQRCSMVFIIKGGGAMQFTDLVKGDLEYLGPMDLTQYYVKSYVIENAYESSGMKREGVVGVRVEIVLGRRLLNQLLTTFLPTTSLCIVAFATNYFKPAYFEAIVTVNLTTMLVLTSLFISISDSQPRTSYVKMIDIWLIFSLLVPFAEVLLHSVLDMLRDPDGDNSIPRPDSGKAFAHKHEAVGAGSWKANLLDKLGKLGFPILFVVFTCIFFGIGLGHSNAE